MANKKKKYVWLAVAGAALATLLAYFSIFWPPVPRSWVQGAIGKRDVYRQETLTDKDVGVAGTVKVTVDDIRAFQQSPEFKSLAGNAQFNQLVANPQFQKIVQDAASMKIQLSNACTPVCPNALPLQNLGQNAQVQQLLNNAQFQGLRNNAQFSALTAMPGFQASVLNSQFVQLAAQSQLSSLVGNAAMQQAFIGTALAK
jgi:CO dehydrogenase/acetyl-CoA synthase epsilon subunit